MAEIRILQSLRDVPRGEWNACFPSVLEDYDYLLAAQEAGIADFAWRYVTAWAGEALVACIPAFLTEYAIDTTFDGGARKIAGALRGLFPNMLTLKLASIGSPVTEYGLAGFAPQVAENVKPELLAQMLAAFESHAVEAGHLLIGLKEIPAFQQALWAEPLARARYTEIPGLPVAALNIDFVTMEEYFARMSPGTRKDMRRKLRARAQLRIEHRTNIDDVLSQVMALYQDTRARAEMQFENLTAKFFQDVLANMPGRAFCTLYFAGDALLGANLLLQDGTTLLDKYFCMDGVRGREFNLYFISWFTNVSYCLEHQLTGYQSGQASYENKVRLGSTLTRTSMYFKHRNRFVQGALRLAAPFLIGEDDALKEAA
jgi:predicted N-acyltransferase